MMKREATEIEIKRAMQDPNVEVCEWPIGKLTYLFSDKNRTIVRTGELGGDTREIHGAWVYPNPLFAWNEWLEITHLPQGVKVR